MAPDDTFARQLLDCEAVFGLRDNPFNPQVFEKVRDRALDQLWSVALKLDEEPSLLPLFVADAGPFRARLEDFVGRLQASGYTSGQKPALGHKSFVFRVVGPQGSGKSTLTNRLVGWLKTCAPGNELLILKEFARPETVEGALERVRGRANEHGEGGCCIVFDDVRLSTEDKLHELFEELREHMAIVMFEIIHHAEDIRRPLPSTRVYAEHLNTTWLTTEHAIAFLSARVALFRVAGVEERLPKGLASFPFDANEVGAMVSQSGAYEPLTLRTLNWVLNEGIERELVRRGPQHAIERLADPDLRALTISAADIYAEVVSEAIGASA